MTTRAPAPTREGEGAGGVLTAGGGSPLASSAPGEFGVYVHIPFCAHRCDYCAFATWTDRSELMGDYAAAVIAEAGAAGLRPATSVFFGGGTPSLLPVDLLEGILEAIPLAAEAEVSVECNPETVTFSLLYRYAKAGVTRLSFGGQSTDPEVLRTLGRRHTPGALRGAAEAAGAAGFAGRYSVDLIYGAAGESLASWERSLRDVLAFDPPPAHLSAYGLTVEPGTPLARDVGRHPDADDQADKYFLADSLLSAAGLDWYELSNWARPGAQCRHNLLYWAQGSYRGLGCAAHSHQVFPDGTARRWHNGRTPERYIRQVAGGGPLEASYEVLDPPTRSMEALMLALRTRAGVPEAALPDVPELAPLVSRSAGRATLTVQGRLLANEVAVRLVLPGSGE